MKRLWTTLLVVVLSGCEVGNGLVVWERIFRVDLDGDGLIAGEEEVEEARPDDEGIAFPEGIDQVHDIAVVDNTLWLWAEDLDDTVGPVLIPVNATTGEAGDAVVIENRPDALDAGSELALLPSAGTFWFTSGDVDGAADGSIFEVVVADGVGRVSDVPIACPFAGNGMLCGGLAWEDSQLLWTAEVGGTQVVRLDRLGGIQGSPLVPWEDQTDTIDFLSADTGSALVVRNGELYRIFGESGAAVRERSVGFTRGGADQDTIWFPSNAERRIFTADVP